MLVHWDLLVHWQPVNKEKERKRRNLSHTLLHSHTARALCPDSEKMREKRIERERKRYGQRWGKKSSYYERKGEYGELPFWEYWVLPRDITVVWPSSKKSVVSRVFKRQKLSKKLKIGVLIPNWYQHRTEWIVYMSQIALVFPWMKWKNKGFFYCFFTVVPYVSLCLWYQVIPRALSKQEYCYRRCLCQDIVVQGNPKVYKGLRVQLERVCNELQRLSSVEEICPETMETIALIGSVLDRMQSE